MAPHTRKKERRPAEGFSELRSHTCMSEKHFNRKTAPRTLWGINTADQFSSWRSPVTDLTTRPRRCSARLDKQFSCSVPSHDETGKACRNPRRLNQLTTVTVYRADRRRAAASLSFKTGTARPRQQLLRNGPRRESWGHLGPVLLSLHPSTHAETEVPAPFKVVRGVS